MAIIKVGTLILHKLEKNNLNIDEITQKTLIGKFKVNIPNEMIASYYEASELNEDNTPVRKNSFVWSIDNGNSAVSNITKHIKKVTDISNNENWESKVLSLGHELKYTINEIEDFEGFKTVTISQDI